MTEPGITAKHPTPWRVVRHPLGAMVVDANNQGVSPLSEMDGFGNVEHVALFDHLVRCVNAFPEPTESFANQTYH